MANEYVTSNELKATLELTGETFADADITLALAAASRGIDNITSRRFYADAAATSVRYYTADVPHELAIDDLVTLTSLKTDEDGDGTFEVDGWTENTDFVLEPLNASNDGKPWTLIAVQPAGSYSFPLVRRGVQVTGKFGWATTPDAIKEATGILASKLLRRAREAPFGVIMAGLDGGGAARIARHDPDVMFLIQPYVRMS